MEEKNLSDGLRGDLKERVRNCRTYEELAQLLKEEGVELPDDQLDAVPGGFCPPLWRDCPADSQFQLPDSIRDRLFSRMNPGSNE